MHKPLRLGLGVILLGILIMTFLNPTSLLMKPLEFKKGLVSHLKEQTTEYVNPEKPNFDESNSYFTRIYTSRFLLDQSPMQAEFSKPIETQDGDNLKVVGYSGSSGGFTVLAYQNTTSGIQHHENWLALTIGGLFIAGITILALFSSMIDGHGLLPRILLVGFMVLGLWMSLKGLLIREAIALLLTN